MPVLIISNRSEHCIFNSTSGNGQNTAHHTKAFRRLIGSLNKEPSWSFFNESASSYIVQIINLQRACAARVTVLGLYVCLCVTQLA